MNLIEYLKEFRQWLITLIFVVIVAGFIWQIRSCSIEDLTNQKEQLEKEKKDLIDEINKLREMINQPPEVKEIVRYKEKVVKKCFKERDNKFIEVNCESAEGNVIPIDVSITKEDCCKLELGTVFKNEFIICEDRNICIKGDESIKLTPEGEEQFKKIVQKVESLNKSGIFKISLLGGYDFVSSYFIIGVQFIDWHGIGIGVDFGSDFKRISDIYSGIFGVYRPSFWSATTNLGFGIGVSTPVKEFSKEYMLQAMILFYVIDF